MSTDNPKISSYVPQVVYDRFKQFQDQHNLPMSQAVILILAEYFGLEQIIRETTKGTTVGGVTLNAFQNMQVQLSELQHQFSLFQLNMQLSDELEQRLSAIEEKLYSLKETSKLLSDTHSELPLFKIKATQPLGKLTSKQLACRLNILHTSSITNQARKSEKEFREWSSSKDPDGIAWIFFKENVKIYYHPIEDTTSELLSSLQVWINENLQSS